MILFSLAPCAVKDLLGSSTDSNFLKSFNKTKSTSTTLACQLFIEATSQTSAARKKDFKKPSSTRYGLNNPILYAAVVSKTLAYPEIQTGNSPPKYILFKRLKIAIA